MVNLKDNIITREFYACKSRFVLLPVKQVKSQSFMRCICSNKKVLYPKIWFGLLACGLFFQWCPKSSYEIGILEKLGYKEFSVCRPVVKICYWKILKPY